LRSTSKELFTKHDMNEVDTSNPLVSIIVPVYNRESILPYTLKNIAENIYRPLEVILIDDGSTDSSLAILYEFKERFAAEDFIIKVILQEHQGAPIARNNGYEHSEGEFIQYLDSDDRIDEEKFKIQTKMMLKSEADFGLCDFHYVYLEDNKYEYHSNSQKLDKIINAQESFGCGSPLLRRELTDKIAWNPDLYRQQDVDYFLKAALLSKKIAYIDKPLYFYLNHDSERISKYYTKTKQVYLQRAKSLIGILKYRYNIVLTCKAMYHLLSSYVKQTYFYK